jgi:hypothetical protein
VDDLVIQSVRCVRAAGGGAANIAMDIGAGVQAAAVCPLEYP